MTNGSGIYFQTGFCSTVGRGAPVYVGLGAGIIAYIVTGLATVDPETGAPVPLMPSTTRVLIALGVGGVAALGTYFTCAGVSKGISIRRK